MAAVWVVACSGESDTTGDDEGDGNTSSWATACERAADAICGKYDECATLLFQGLIPSDCHGFYLSGCLDNTRLSDVNITPSEYLACANAFNRLSCDDWLYNGESPPECQNVPGERPVGDACGNGLQCASRACTAGGGECGVCEVRAAEGESCADRTCGLNLTCDEQGICTRPTHLGDPCSVDAPCDLIQVCRGGVCSKPPGDGEPCATDGLSCDLFQLLSCNPTTMLCESESIPCLGEDCSGLCRGGAVCNLTSGICGAPLPEGAACSEDDRCEASLECIGSVCRRFDPTTCN